jgi:peptide/nickel transport system substrate-binding protein
MKMGVRATLVTAALATIAVLALLLSGCGGGASTSGSASGGSENEAKPKHGGSIEVAQGEEVKSLSPTEALDQYSFNAMAQILETLYRVNGEGKTIPWLALSATPTNHDKMWTVKLRPGVEFSNGKPLTAEDAVFSLEQARHSPTWEFLYTQFKTIKATSPSTIEITTTQPLPAMKPILGNIASGVVPKNFEGMPKQQFFEDPVGTGPFKVGSWKHGESLTLVRNPNYWEKGRPYLDELTFREVPNDSSRVSQLRGGSLDAIEAPPYAQISGLEAEPGVKVGIYYLTWAQYVILNANSQLFKDSRLREAVNLAVDRTGVIESALSGKGQVGGSFLSPPIPYHDDNIKPERDVEKAAELVAEAKAEGTNPAFTILTISGQTYQTLAAQVIQQNLDEAGFKVSIQAMDESALLERLYEGEYEATLEKLGPGILDPSENVAVYIATAGLFSNADLTKTTKLAEEGSAELDSAKRQQIYYKIQQEVADQHYLITLGYEPFVWAFSDKFTGFNTNPFGGNWFADVGLAEG